MRKSKPTIAVTTGDPEGIGSEIIIKALKVPSLKKKANWKIFGNLTRKYSAKDCGKMSWESLEKAVDAIRAGQCDALVTGPVAKDRLYKAGFPFPGQTEFLARRFGVKKFAMMMVSPRLRVVLVTIHEALKDVPHLLTPQKILDKILLTDTSLKKIFRIKNPRIAVCGLNPHAGEKGEFGNEERITIRPAVIRAQRRHITVEGPLPPDTVFHLAVAGKYDAVICQYHDQGLIPIKTLAFHQTVNLTIGLPIVRTSPDHGPAFDLAGTGKANPSSLIAAMSLAVSSLLN